MINTYITVGIDIDTAENVFCVVLKQQYLDLSAYVGRGSDSGSKGCPLFSVDEEENKVQFEALKKAFELVMIYNGVKYERSEVDEK